MTRDEDRATARSYFALWAVIILTLGAFGQCLIVLDRARDRIKELETEAAALQACMPQFEGDISAMARRDGLLECAMSSRGVGKRVITSRFSYKT